MVDLRSLTNKGRLTKSRSKGHFLWNIFMNLPRSHKKGEPITMYKSITITITITLQNGLISMPIDSISLGEVQIKSSCQQFIHSL